MSMAIYKHGDKVFCDGMTCHVIEDKGGTVVVSVVAARNELKGSNWIEVDRWVWKKEVSKKAVTPA